MAKKRRRVMNDGEIGILPIRKNGRSITAVLPTKVLRYLRAKPGDKIKIVARDGFIELRPRIDIIQEIEAYISKRS